MNLVPGRGFPLRRGADLTGLRAVVMGLGHFSGGVETARFFAERGARVLVTDRKPAAELSESVAALAGLPVELRLGGHRAEDFAGADLVVASPAVPPESEWLARAAAAGAAIVTELSLTMALLAGRVVWVTGSMGKSTTTALLGEMLARGGVKSRIGGNIGRALLCAAESVGPDEVVVLEVSSFQLEWMARDGFVPHLAVLTNVVPNHLDRHGSFERYREAKAVALAGPGPAILNAEDLESFRLAGRARGPVHFISATGPVKRGACLAEGVAVARSEAGDRPLFPAAELKLSGDFHRQNALQAALAAHLLGAPAEAIRAAVREFGGLPHRLEDLGRIGGVRAVNDSKATTPEAAIRALHAVREPIVLVAGGQDRGADLAAFAEAIRARARAVVVLGETADRLAEAIGRNGPPVARAATIEEAVEAGLELARPGDVLLLSPGHPSWDQHRNYEERGDRFRRRFQTLAAARESCPPAVSAP